MGFIGELKNTGRGMKNKDVLKFFAFVLPLLTLPSISLGLGFEGYPIENGKNFSIIVVELPPHFYRQTNFQKIWEEIYGNVTCAKKYLKLTNETILSEFKDLSLPKIVKHLNATVWKESKKYAYLKIILSNESYGKAVEAFKGLGLKVRKNLPMKLHLSESRRLVGLPYYASTHGRWLTGEGTKIAILDTGVDTTHPDLPWGTKVIFWNDTYSDPSDPAYLPNPSDQDPYGHGTHVCSIAAGTGANSSGLYKGIAPNASLLVWRVCADGGCDPTAIAEAIRQAVREKVDVISMSFGYNPQIWNMWFERGDVPCSFEDICRGNCYSDVQELFDAISSALDSNIPVVASAGNEGSHLGTVSFPACIEKVIAVGAAHKDDLSYYECIEEDVLEQLPEEEKITLHSIISVITDNPVQTYEKEFDATWRFYGIPHGVRVFFPTGFQKILQPQNWPATIQVKIEGEHKHRECYNPERVWWDPGLSEKGDGYWVWEKTFDYDPSKPYIVVEISVLANGDRGGPFSCPFDPNDWWKAYYNTYTCSGTAKSCDTFDYSWENCIANGCSWCGCYDPWYECCTGGTPGECLWLGCLSEEDCEDMFIPGCGPTPCSERSQEKGLICGSPSTTGCTTNWDTSLISVRMYRTSENSLEGLPTFFSSRGPSIFSPKPDVIAPGKSICAAKASGVEGEPEEMICGNDNYIAYSGTSMAAPMVAGEIALIKEAARMVGINPSVYEIREAVRKANEKVFPGNPDDQEGYGLIDIQKAVDYLTDCKLKHKDGWYCNGEKREYRQYYYDDSSSSCKYRVLLKENCNRDSDEGKNYKVRGTCTEGSCSNGKCISHSSYTDTCVCYPTCTYGSPGCDITRLITCAARSSKSECESDSLCFWALQEYFVSGNSCSRTIYNCSNLGPGYYCYAGRCYRSGGGGGGGGIIVISKKSCILQSHNLIHKPTSCQ